jgi:hypothetical protein
MSFHVRHISTTLTTITHLRCCGLGDLAPSLAFDVVVVLDRRQNAQFVACGIDSIEFGT